MRLPEPLETIALIGNHLPRQCGIATFTTDLAEAVAAESESNVMVVAMNERPDGYLYPERVRFEVAQNKPSDYELAANVLNMRHVDVACLQHEYGIFGGANGSYILKLLRELRMPLVTTLHTVLREPLEGQKQVLTEIIKLSDRVVVMSERAVEFLVDIYGAPREKVEFIHHGIPDMPFVDPNYYKDQFGAEGRKVILTFGLLSPGKGIEYMIRALPTIAQKHPDVLYIVLGATHPNVKRKYGEEYRLGLQRLAEKLDVKQHVVFHNRFANLTELCEFLGAADIYVTPYLNEAQIVSGTLAYALGAGKAAVSTPYWYAQEMLADGRGRLVPFRDSDALAAEIVDLLDNEVERHAMRKRAYDFCRQMVWSEVARRYLETFSDAKAERRRHPRPIFRIATIEHYGPEAPEVNLSHLQVLTDDTGILQHSKFSVPDRREGYCTDDVARALIAVLMAQPFVSDEDVIDQLASRYLAFLGHAFDYERLRFRNFMSYDRRWLEDVGSEDSHGRALWALGTVTELARDEDHIYFASDLFHNALPPAAEFRSPRAVALSVLGANAYLSQFSGETEVKRLLQEMAEWLHDQFLQTMTDEWPWLEDCVTYANAHLPHALMRAGALLGDDEMVTTGLTVLRWLVDVQTTPQGHIAPIGSNGWYPRGKRPARFDQQPIEVSTLMLACMAAYDITGDDQWAETARCCFEWFMGRNDLGVALYDYATGGCRDALHPERVNLNQGAESTIACIMSMLAMHSLMAKTKRRTPAMEQEEVATSS